MPPSPTDHDSTHTFRGAPAEGPSTALPSTIGRYRVERLLGRGGFGTVYLARDDQLQRHVAIKVPHREVVHDATVADIYLSEARTVAALDHPNIVPVLDVGSTAEFPFFMVSKFVEGSTLARRTVEARLPLSRAAEILAVVAGALHYAHRRGVVHRDVKPSNILIDGTGRPYVCDFGLALKEEGHARDLGFAGTPPYMSPEQIRGEGHRVDGRSDVFSLGVVLYELLIGHRPFWAESTAELLWQVMYVEPRPPRQVNDEIPRELERICLKALAKRAADRYTTAQDLAEELRQFLAEAPPGGRPATAAARPPAADPVVSPASAREAVRVVPRGLRAFDAHDADFFVELLPGPRDRDGLPDVLRFWKTRVEQPEPEDTFPVGLIYGPSGCGKSSLVQAGLIPRLAGRVIPVYVEATAGETERRLLAGLRRRCGVAAEGQGLADTLAAVRRGAELPAGRKVLIVLDQFEQWLHARRNEAGGAELVQALRQCDGARVQCLILVRDDFWLAVSRFFRDLEVDLAPGRNVGLVDLFDIGHARAVLAAFGRAYGRVPERADEVSAAQKEFLRRAVDGLAQDGRVICVRLALFAEMMKGRDWTPAALRAVGGTEGIGVRFLEDSFSAPTANPRHRVHQAAARAVLTALLPEVGSDIKGRMRSDAELLAASGYAARPRDFEELLRILDAEVRLITPTDPAGPAPEAADRPTAGPRYFQLTHDYLVPPLREWLTRKQRETWRGRAELRLAARAAAWAARPEPRNLCSGAEWVAIRLLTKRRTWSTAQRQMMRAASRRFAIRAAAVVLLAAVVVATAWDYLADREAEQAVRNLLTADLENVPSARAELARHPRRAGDLLRAAATTESDPGRRLRLSLALVDNDPAQVDYLCDRMLAAPPAEFAAIRDGLSRHGAGVADRLWPEFANPAGPADRRFRAAVGLVAFAPDDRRRDDAVAHVILNLAANPVELANWKDVLRSVGPQLLPPLAAALEDAKWDDSQRRTIIAFYRHLAGGRPDGLEPLRGRLGAGRPLTAADAAEARRKATLLAALAALGEPGECWPLLAHSPDPTLRSYLIERLAASGGSPGALRDRFDHEPDVSARRALVLAIGGTSPGRAVEYVPWLLQLYETDPDPGIHGAAGWALRTLDRTAELTAADTRLASRGPARGRDWYVIGPGQGFSVLHSPADLLVKPPAGPRPSEHVFAVAPTEVTVAQFLEFKPDHRERLNRVVAPRDDCPVHNVSWHEAAAFCNWLSAKIEIPESQHCYRRRSDGFMEPVPDFQRRRGFRLPTEAEWEFACRADATTDCAFGRPTRELADHYAFWRGNGPPDIGQACGSVGTLKPNDWGLFDLHGNVAEWCNESTRPPKNNWVDDVECTVRGGTYQNGYEQLSWQRRGALPRKNFREVAGFRPVQTVSSKFID